MRGLRIGAAKQDRSAGRWRLHRWQVAMGDKAADRRDTCTVADYARQHLQFKTKFALCHGARSGHEAEWFRELLTDEHEQVWGTELSPIAARIAPWTMAADLVSRRPP